ncbi:structural maintenance of chromosome protein, type 1 [Theileria orientalis]|uniref:Structural maintenance of chromosomes protein n=1 Tax=Theileria orientalis TaxID=68886 RepID=A0A976M9N9_THEOR|nr:structural maintenance of chromosome protein, type 1 [Theileria orientalis]
MDIDSDSLLSLSDVIRDNVTEVVEPEPSQTIDDVLINLNNERYELNAFPHDSDHRLKRGSIHSIELHNFKSYYGTVFINKLSSFNAIIGPNGSGKSNLMDAISFVLCIRASTLRGSNLRDLINKNPDKSDPIESRYAYVALTLRGDTGFSVFKRAINSKGNISYIYNNNVITFKGYTEALNEYKINTLGSTGLIFQGSVNDIISRSPSELTRLFENISGSSLYEKPYNYIKEKLELIRSDYKNVLSKKKQLNNELKQFRTIKSTNRKYQQQLEEYNQTQLDSYTCQFKILANKFHHSSSRYKTLTNDYKDLVQKFEKSTKRKNELEEKIANLYYNQGKVNRAIQQKTQLLNEKRNSMTEFFGVKASLESKIENMNSMKVNAENDATSSRKQYEEYKKSRSDLADEINRIKKEMELAKGDSVMLTDSQMEEFNRYLKEFKNLTCSINVNINVVKTSMNQFKSENKQVVGRLKGLESQMERVDENIIKHNQLIDSFESKLVDYKDELETLQITIHKMENEKSELMEERQELSEKRDSYDERIKALGVLKYEHNYMFKKSLVNSEMSKAIEKVYGEVMSLFEVSNSSYLKPVMSALGSRVYTIVAGDYKAITQCIQFLKDKKAGRREFLALDTLNYDKSATRRTISHHLRRVPKLEYVFVIDSIDFEKKFEPLFEYLVGDTLIVPTLDDAERVVKINMKISSSENSVRRSGTLFGSESSTATTTTTATATTTSGAATGGYKELKNKNESQLNFNVVTHNGQLITRDKTIVIGSTIAASNSEVESEIAKFNKYVNLLNEVEKQLTASLNREKTLNDEIQNKRTKLEKYKRMMQLTTMKVELLKKQKESIKLQQSELSEEMAKLTKQSKTLERSITNMSGDLTKENNKLERLKMEHFGPLNKKFGIDDVYSLLKTRDERVDSLNSILNEKKSTFSRYENDLKDLETKMEMTKNKIGDLERQLLRYGKELEELKGSNVNVCDEMERLQKEIEDYKVISNEYVDKIEQCNSEMNNLRPDYDTYGPDGRVNVMEEISSLRNEMKKIYMEAIGLSETCKVKNIPLEIRVKSNLMDTDSTADDNVEIPVDYNSPGIRGHVDSTSNNSGHVGSNSSHVGSNSSNSSNSNNNNSNSNNSNNNNINNNNNSNSNNSNNNNSNSNTSNNNSNSSNNSNNSNNNNNRVGSFLFNLNEIDDVDYAQLNFPTLVKQDGKEGRRNGSLGVDDPVPDEKYEMTLSNLENQNESYQRRLKELKKSLSTWRSYNNVDDRLEITGEELKIVDRELDTLRSQLVKLESDFENIKRERSGLFLHCFQAVKESVGPIYSKLSSVEGAEGQAFLSLDDVATLDPEPFNCSIRYNTMPPMKKYLDLNLQSGGEKALSSIALLLALHNYRESPFVVLDEIDANIDAVKLRNLTDYLKESTFQVIIISLKEKLFSNAQRLIGVYRNHPSFTSNCLVLNLEEYEQEAE